MNTPNYIKSLVTPQSGKKPQGRKVWSIDLETVWLPFFTATNTMGDTRIPSDAIGCPMRLAYDKAGAVRFSNTGKPVIRVAKELSDNVRMVRDNFQANLLAYAGEVMTQHPEEYGVEFDKAQKAGAPIAQHDSQELSKAVAAMAEAEALAKAEAAKTAESTTMPETKELVGIS
jgi:hypothetical protein